MDLDSQFDRVPVPIHRDGGITHIKVENLCQGMARENFISGEEEVNQNHNIHVASLFNIFFETKNIKHFKFTQLQKRSSICQNNIQRDQRKFSFGRKVKYFFENLGNS